MLQRMGWSEQREYPRLGLGLPVTLLFLGRGQFEAELQDISRGGCFFKSDATVALDKRISVVLSANGGKTCQASGRVVRTVAYRGFAVLFDQDDTASLDEGVSETASVLFVLPPLAIFFLSQRVFVQGGIQATGLKG